MPGKHGARAAPGGRGGRASGPASFGAGARPAYLDPALRSDSPWAKQWKRMSVDELRDELEGYIKR